MTGDQTGPHARGFRQRLSLARLLPSFPTSGSKRDSRVSRRDTLAALHNELDLGDECLHKLFTICRRLPHTSPGQACRRALPACAGATAATSVGGHVALVL